MMELNQDDIRQSLIDGLQRRNDVQNVREQHFSPNIEVTMMDGSKHVVALGGVEVWED